MDHVRLFLKTPLFSFGRSHGPAYADAMALDGKAEDAPGGLKIVASAWFDRNGKPLEDVGTHTLLVPFAKIDHVALLDGDEA